MGAIALLIVLVLIIGFIYTTLGIDSDIAVVASIVTVVLILVGMAIYSASGYFKNTSFTKKIREHYSKAVMEDPVLKGFYDTGLEIIRKKIDESTINPLATARIALLLPNLKGTVFYDCYGELTQTPEDLCYLYAQRQAYGMGKLSNPYSDELLPNVKQLTLEEETIIGLNPWLLSKL